MSLVLGEPRVNLFGEQYYSEVNNQLFEKNSYETIYRRFLQDAMDSDEALFIVVGSDSGLLPKHLNSMNAKPAVKYLIVEFKERLAAFGLSALNAQSASSIEVVNEQTEFGEIYERYESFFIRKKVYIVSSMCAKEPLEGSGYDSLYRDVNSRFQRFYTTVLVSQKTKDFEKIRLLNAVDNIVPIKDFKGAIRGTTAIVLGGGPTLDQSIEWIKANQDKYIIFAAGRISRRLYKEGIVPHFIVTVDPQDISFDNAKDLLRFSDKRTVLIHSYHANHRLVAQWGGRALYFGDKYGWYDARYYGNIDAPGPTVINAAVHLAIELGCEKLVMSGVDFCYVDGASHESASDEAQVLKTLRQRNVSYTVVNNAGCEVETRKDYDLARQSLQAYIHGVLKTQPQLVFVNTSLDSASIDGVEYCAVDKLTFESCNSALKEFESKLNFGFSDYFTAASQTLDELKAKRSELKKLEKVCLEGLAETRKLYSRGSDDPKLKAMNKVLKLRKKINNQVGQDGDLLFSFDAQLFQETFAPVNDQTKLSSDEIKMQFVGFFGGLEKVCQQFIQIIDWGVERAELRLDELALDKPLAALVKKWQSWNEIGRVERWVAWHQDQISSLSETDLAILFDAQQEYKRLIDNSETRRVINLKNRIENPENLLKRAESAFEGGDQKALEALLTFIKESPQNYQGLMPLVQGMVSEIRGDFTNAKVFYSQVNEPSLKKPALVQRLQISLEEQEHQESLILLEQLCSYSLEYMLPYADLLKIIGQPQMAIEVLTLYLSQNPLQINGYLKMAGIYQEMNQVQDAKIVLQKIMEIDPSNKTAKAVLSSLN